MAQSKSENSHARAEVERYRRLLEAVGEDSWIYRKPWAIGAHREFAEFAVVLELLDLPAGSRVMELGCGCGWLSLFLARVGYKTLGVDLSEEMVRIASQRAAGEGVDAEFRAGDMQHFDPGSPFDGVVIHNSLHHVPDPGAVLRRAYHCLRPQGRVVIGEATWLHRYSPNARQTAEDAGIREDGFTKGRLRRLLRQAGFRRIRFHYETGRIYGPSPAAFLASLLRLVMLRFFAWPGMKYWVTAEK